MLGHGGVINRQPVLPETILASIVNIMKKAKPAKIYARNYGHISASGLCLQSETELYGLRFSLTGKYKNVRIIV